MSRGENGPGLSAGAAGPPRAGVLLARVVSPLDRLFNRIYSSRHNPLYQSGNLAVVCFLVTLVSGLYLFLFYKIADPHGSVEAIRERIWLGGWARSLHRYAADLALVATAAHVLRKLLHGHTWGPRALAWLSGVALLGVIFASGWTGLVLVWDLQGHRIAVEGARLFDLLPVLAEPISRMFAGVDPVPSSFFFMNLFLHVALPLGLAALLAVHVSRVARPALLPPRALLYGLLATLAAVAWLAPVSLSPAADLRALSARMPVDLLFAFWLPIARRVPPLLHLALWLVGFGSLAALARLWRPPTPIAPSRVDEDHCSGCTSCYQDCPYDAIAMVRRERPSRQTSEFVARVDPTLCVGCGICAAACAPMGVGPPRRGGRDQLVEARRFLELEPHGGFEVAVLVCGNGFGRQLDRLAAPGRRIYATGCSGSLHTAVLELLLRRGVRGLFVLGCPPRDCTYREGPKWIEERVHGGRAAELHARVDRVRIQLAARSVNEMPEVLAELARFERRIRQLPALAEERVELEPACDLAAAERVLEELARG